MRSSQPGFALVAFVLVALGQGAAGAVQEPATVEPEDLSFVLEPKVERAGVPGMACALVRADGLHGIGAAGVRRVGSETKVETTDLWHLGSCTKSMTATLVARLVERERITWDTTLGEVFGERVEGMDFGWDLVTVAQLLAHRGGTPADVAPDLWSRLWIHPGSPTEQRWALLEGTLVHAPETQPGTAYVYSNTGFALAGAMLEVLEGEPWEDLMRRELFEPLGMETAGFGAPGTPGELDQPLGHSQGPDGLAPVELGPGDDNPPAIGPAGTVHASIADWARYAACHLRAGRDDAGRDDKRFLSPATFAVLHTPAEGESYVAGWGVREEPWAEGPVLQHAGSNTMWYCALSVAPEDDLAILVATNAGGDEASKAVQEVAVELVELATGE